MKLKWVVGSIMLASAITMALPASANVMVQRGCKPDDIQLSGPQPTLCTWAKGDSNMQFTAHGSSGFTNAKVTCNFTPVQGSNDKVAMVQPHGEAKISNVNNNGYDISFDLYAPASGKNANVMFWLNKPLMQTDFTPGDTLSCTFSNVHSSK